MAKPSEREFLAWALLGDEDAISFAETIGQITQQWDDLFDEGVAPGDETVNELLWAALVRLPVEPFYQRWFNVLYPLLRQMIVDWLDANELQKGTDHDKLLAYVLRDSSAGLVTQCAGLVGGYAWMRQVGPAIRRYFMDEPIEEFKEEHRGESGQ